MFQTYLELFEHRVSEHGHSTAARHRVENNWEAVSWREWWLESERFAAALMEYIQPNDRVGLMSETRFEWLIVETATMMTRAISVAIFPQCVTARLTSIVEDAQPTVMVLEGPSQLERFLECGSECKVVILLDRVSTFYEPDVKGRTVLQLEDVEYSDWDGAVILFDTFMAAGRRAYAKSATLLAERRMEVAEDDVATIAYTAGTTDDRRGVVLTHANIIAQVNAVDAQELVRPGETQLLTLPLAHIFARVMLWVSVARGVETAVGTGLQTMVRDAAEVQPHVVAAVPALLENFRKGIRRDLRRFGSLRERALELVHHSGVTFRFVDNLRRTVGSQLAENALHRLFGPRLRRFVSGGAKLDPKLAEFFSGIGVDVVHGYALAETAGFVAIGVATDHQSTAVGFPVEGVDVTMGEEREIWVRGSIVTPGYFRAGREPECILNDEGWLQTGDIGSFDDAGRVEVIGRINDEVVTSGGRKVEPRSIELMLQDHPKIKRAFVTGDGRAYVVALLELIQGEFVSESEIASHIGEVNAAIATTPTIRKYEAIPDTFSSERGELTESGKLRRAAIVRTRHHLIEAMYVDRVSDPSWN